MATIVKSKKGNKIVLLNPAEKGRRFARQLKKGRVEETGKVLSPQDKAYRAGYLDARTDNAIAYCYKKGIKSKAKESRRQRRQKRKAFKN